MEIIKYHDKINLLPIIKAIIPEEDYKRIINYINEKIDRGQPSEIFKLVQ